MGQIHKGFTSEQVKTLLKGWYRGVLDRSAVQEVLGIGKTRFFALLKEYRLAPDAFDIDYQRQSPGRLRASAEQLVEMELLAEKDLVEDASLPITTYNYSAVRDRLRARDHRGLVYRHRPRQTPGLLPTSPQA